MDMTNDAGTSLFSIFAIMGFSTFVGYAIGMALKKMLMIAVFVLGVFFLGVSLLQYNGIIGGVDWGGYAGALQCRCRRTTGWWQSLPGMAGGAIACCQRSDYWVVGWV